MEKNCLGSDRSNPDDGLSSWPEERRQQCLQLIAFIQMFAVTKIISHLRIIHTRSQYASA
jgi:hypothetical protein